ncbi:hypothetical protein [Nocardiopsis synnemataformans]|uniref:hypothetical protein n=1 Tax=Nocardiopsis synnemataformans TaxID=61305 RepID=UPI003EBAA6CE
MNPYAPAPPMPGPLKAVRVILIIRIVLAAILYSLALFGLVAVASLPSAQVEAEMGMGVGGLAAILLFGLALTAFEVYVAIALGKGGDRARTLVLVVVGLGFASALLNLLTDSSNPALGIVLMAVILILIRTESAKEWFRVTDPRYQPLQGGHPGQGGYPGQSGPGGYPGHGGNPKHPGPGGYPDQAGPTGH